MKNLLIAISFVSGMLVLASCGSENNRTEETTTTTETTDRTNTTVEGSDSTLTDEQKDLFEHIARHNLLQVELGRLAAERGSTDQVKQYGRQMADAYAAKQKELQEMAQTYGITPEQGINENYRDDVDEVSKADQGKFDKTYWDNVIDAQEDLLKEYDSVIKDVPDTNATAFYTWARTSMQELRAQMEEAMGLEKQLKSDL